MIPACIGGGGPAAEMRTTSGPVVTQILIYNEEKTVDPLNAPLLSLLSIGGDSCGFYHLAPAPLPAATGLAFLQTPPGGHFPVLPPSASVTCVCRYS